MRLSNAYRSLADTAVPATGAGESIDEQRVGMRLMQTVQRLDVRASLDDPAAAMAMARGEASAGDESWEQWAAEFERGEALVVRLDITVAAQDANPELIETVNRGVFVEKDVHPPKLEQQI